MSVKGTVHALYVMHYQHYCTIYIIQCVLYTAMYILPTCSRYNALTATLTCVMCIQCVHSAPCIVSTTSCAKGTVLRQMNNQLFTNSVIISQ